MEHLRHCHYHCHHHHQPQHQCHCHYHHHHHPHDHHLQHLHYHQYIIENTIDLHRAAKSRRELEETEETAGGGHVGAAIAMVMIVMIMVMIMMTTVMIMMTTVMIMMSGCIGHGTQIDFIPVVVHAIGGISTEISCAERNHLNVHLTSHMK